MLSFSKESHVEGSNCADSVRVRVRASVTLPIAMFPHNQSGYFSGNTSGRRPIWNLFGLPATMIDVGHGFPQSVHMNVGVAFE